uniref:Large ribosomal subunit protein uL23 N-terminal domain-containing protein n=1 Tax=Lotharella globosa TaxID=91324 RepID=A0A6V3U074_9EUKA
MAKDAVKKAKAATKSMKKGKLTKKGSKIRNTVHFKLPKTLKVLRNPKYSKRSVNRKTRLDKFTIVKYPLCTESAMKQIEDNNTLTFIVDIKANKHQIKKAVHDLYQIETVKINTLIRPDGKKKAYVRLPANREALEIANTIGII